MKRGDRQLPEPETNRLSAVRKLMRPTAVGKREGGQEEGAEKRIGGEPTRGEMILLKKER